MTPIDKSEICYAPKPKESEPRDLMSLFENAIADEADRKLGVCRAKPDPELIKRYKTLTAMTANVLGLYLEKKLYSLVVGQPPFKNEFVDILQTTYFVNILQTTNTSRAQMHFNPVSGNLYQKAASKLLESALELLGFKPDDPFRP